MFQSNDMPYSSAPTSSLDDSENMPFFDINRVPGNGTLVFPLSMSRLFLGQDPKVLYAFLCFFDKKIIEKTVDIVFAYTNGLYFNNAANSADLRQKTNAQMITHKRELSNLIKKGGRFSPSAVHYMSWDSLLLQADNYMDVHAKLLKLSESDTFFKQLLTLESKAELNYDFIIEETIITYLIRNKWVSLPHTLAKPDGWRLLCYPGSYLMPDVYLHQNTILHHNPKTQWSHWFDKLTSSSMYNMEKRVLIDYTKVNLNSFFKNG